MYCHLWTYRTTSHAYAPHALYRAYRRWYYALLVLTTLYIIFADDVKRAALPTSWDLALEVIATVILVFIIAEMGE